MIPNHVRSRHPQWPSEHSRRKAEARNAAAGAVQHPQLAAIGRANQLQLAVPLARRPVHRRLYLEPLGAQQEPRPADGTQGSDRPVQRHGEYAPATRVAVRRALQRVALTKVRAIQNGMRRKGGADLDRPPDDWHVNPRSNEKH